MTRQIAVEYPTQIRANCICPGTVDSPFVEGYLEKYHSRKGKVRAELNLRQRSAGWDNPGDRQPGALPVLSRSGLRDRLGNRYRWGLDSRLILSWTTA